MKHNSSRVHTLIVTHIHAATSTTTVLSATSSSLSSCTLKRYEYYNYRITYTLLRRVFRSMWTLHRMIWVHKAQPNYAQISHTNWRSTPPRAAWRRHRPGFFFFNCCKCVPCLLAIWMYVPCHGYYHVGVFADWCAYHSDGATNLRPDSECVVSQFVWWSSWRFWNSASRPADCVMCVCCVCWQPDTITAIALLPFWSNQCRSLRSIRLLLIASKIRVPGMGCNQHAGGLFDSIVRSFVIWLVVVARSTCNAKSLASVCSIVRNWTIMQMVWLFVGSAKIPHRMWSICLYSWMVA